MGLNLADFITGRAIGEKDEIVAVVIVPAEGGYPDAVKSAAVPPVYPHERFEPISLPLHGVMNERGFFSPGEQPALQLFFELAGVSSWEEFERRALNEPDVPFEFSHPNKRAAELLGFRRVVVPGLAIMHRSTAETLKSFAIFADEISEIDLATEICLDARARGADPASYNKTQLRGAPGQDYLMADGRVVSTPWLLGALNSGSGTELSALAVNFIERVSDDRVRDTFASISEFQRIATGLRVVHRYWAPSAFARRDNLFEIAELQIRDLEAALKGVSDRMHLGPDYRDEPSKPLAELAARLRGLAGIVEAELALHDQAVPAP